MKAASGLPVAVVLMAAPLTAFAQGGAPHILLYSFGGGFAGGLLGALLACWLCKRGRGSTDTTDSKKY